LIKIWVILYTPSQCRSPQAPTDKSDDTPFAYKRPKKSAERVKNPLFDYCEKCGEKIKNSDEKYVLFLSSPFASKYYLEK
jgi:hypothetical protein